MLRGVVRRRPAGVLLKGCGGPKGVPRKRSGGSASQGAWKETGGEESRPGRDAMDICS